MKRFLLVLTASLLTASSVYAETATTTDTTASVNAKTAAEKEAEAKVLAQEIATGGYLVLSQDPEDEPIVRSTWISNDPKVAPKSVEAPVFYYNDTVYSYEVTLPTYNSVPCECFFEEQDEEANEIKKNDQCPNGKQTLKEKKMNQVTIRDLTHGKKLWESKLYSELSENLDEKVGDVSMWGTVAGLLGPYLILENCYNLYACGAHGATSCTSTILNLNTNQVVPLKTFNLGSFTTKELICSMEWPEEVRDDSCDFNEWVSIDPRYVPAGIDVNLRVIRSTCYACSSGDWSSYNYSQFMKLDWSSKKPDELSRNGQKKLLSDVAPDLKDHLVVAPTSVLKAVKGEVLGVQPLPKDAATYLKLKNHFNSVKKQHASILNDVY